MLKKFFNRKYPDFWKRYSDHFKVKTQNDLSLARFVVFDTETTGLDVSKDRVLSIGAIGIIDNKMNVADSFEVYLKQEVFNTESVGIHGILKEGNIKKTTENEAIVEFLDYIKDAILVAHHAAFDVTMINKGLARLGLPKLKNRVLDTGVLFKKTNLCNDKTQHYSLDQLTKVFNLKRHDRHTASGDAYLTGIVFMKIVSDLKRKRDLKLKDLFFNSDRTGLL